MALTEQEQARYSRQILIRDLGEAGQEKLKRSTVFIAGAGGLGCPVATYLAVAGVGHMILVDQDSVDPSNLNRQILHWNEDIGLEKVASARAKLSRMNPSVRITPVRTTIDRENARSLIRGADLVIDAMDNYQTRFYLNRAAIQEGIPIIHASVRGFEGRITMIIPGETPCIECLTPEVPPDETVPIVGATAGVIGSLQATEAIKMLTGIGTLLKGRMLIYDGEYLEFHEIPVSRDQACTACSHLWERQTYLS